jgi:hypothetical protein
MIKRVLTRLIPARIKVLLRGFLLVLPRMIERHIFVFFKSNGFLASVYYAFFNTRFYREHKAVLCGRFEYLNSLHDVGMSSALLRRNTHRLEKGLVMRPRRPVFAEDYILETVQCYVHAIKGGKLYADEKRWAESVLSMYFNEVEDTRVIKKAREMFNKATSEQSVASSFVPYAHNTLPEPGVSFDQI